ncbi:MAG: hypothetical protein H8E44_34720 [Planctomycetes bacterium]|nr:hypothetical protein [Planctomycetota bacterium]MBL7042917.1 hypothetical protein [Pirellulaceae bacterium]
MATAARPTQGAQSVLPPSVHAGINDDLQAVIDAWPDPPEAGILAMVKAAK